MVDDQSFEPRYITLKLFIVRVSVKGLCVFVWAGCGSDVIVIYDVTEH